MIWFSRCIVHARAQIITPTDIVYSKYCNMTDSSRFIILLSLVRMSELQAPTRIRKCTGISDDHCVGCCIQVAFKSNNDTKGGILSAGQR